METVGQGSQLIDNTGHSGRDSRDDDRHDDRSGLDQWLKTVDNTL